MIADPCAIFRKVFYMLLRFTPEEKTNRHPCAFLPFGAGPRVCIGSRFALLEEKMALIEILSKYKFELAPETKVCCLHNHNIGINNASVGST